jgi:methionyl-tRNA formyltransferase
MDAGDILAQAKTQIGPEETAGELHDRLAKLAAPLLIETLNRIEDNTAAYTKQEHSKATLAPKLKKADGFLDFSEHAEVLVRKIHGFWPWPGASANYISCKTGKSIRVTIAMTQIVGNSNPSRLPTGTFDDNLNVICGKDALHIEKIKPAGSDLMTFRAFINGRQTQPGDKLIKITEI